MKRFVDRLEGGYRVVKIRRIRRYVYLILTLVTISFAIAVMAANGGSLRPFYLPLDIVIGVLLIMAVVWLALTFMFRNLRIRYATRGSQKFLLAKNSIRRGLAIVVFATIVGVLFVMPFFHSVTEDQLKREETKSVSSGIEEEVNFSLQG